MSCSKIQAICQRPHCDAQHMGKRWRSTQPFCDVHAAEREDLDACWLHQQTTNTCLPVIEVLLGYHPDAVLRYSRTHRLRSLRYS